MRFRIENLFKICKVWMISVYVLTGIGWLQLINNNIFNSIIDQIYFVFIGLTIGTIPIAVTRYFSSKKKIERYDNAVH